MENTNFPKYEKIYVLGHEDNERIFDDPEDEIIIEEKIDGGNFRFYISEEGKVIIGSRTQQLTSNEGEDDNMNKQFRRCSDFVREKLKGKKLKDYTGYIFYGENCIKHTMSYDWEKIPPFLGFDIKASNGYVGYATKCRLFSELDLPIVPLIWEGKAKDIPIINESFVPKSVYQSATTEDQQAEGVVIKNYSKGIFAKYVRDAFKEANAETFGGNPKYNKGQCLATLPDGNEVVVMDESNNTDFVFKYCTNARIDKLIFELIDEGNKLDMPLMKELPKRIYLDIWEENWQEIRDSNWMLDFKKLRKLVPRRCLAVLKQVIVNNSLPEK